MAAAGEGQGAAAQGRTVDGPARDLSGIFSLRLNEIVVDG